MTEMYSTMTVALSSFIERRRWVNDFCKPAAVSSTFLSNNADLFLIDGKGEDEATEGEVVREDDDEVEIWAKDKRSYVDAFYKYTN